jgi:hypothetical protein
VARWDSPEPRATVQDARYEPLLKGNDVRHLYAVPDPPEGPNSTISPPRTTHPDAAHDPDPVTWDAVDDRGLAIPHPSVDRYAVEVDELYVGLSTAERLEALRTQYRDADGRLQARSLRLRPSPGPTT